MEASGLRLRESFRVAVTGRARLLVGAASTTVDATVLDLSTTGMGLATAVATPKPPVGEVCAFELLIDGARIEGRGVVVWSRRARPDRGDAPNVGIRFERLEGVAQREIAALVEHRLGTGRWPSPAPALAAGGAVAAVTEQQLTLAVAAAPIAPPPSAPPLADPAPPPRPTPPAAPVAPPIDARIERFEEAAPKAKRWAVLVAAIAAAVLLLAIVAVGLFGREDRAEPEAPELDEAAPRELAVNEKAPGEVAATAASIEPASGEADPIAAEPAAIVAAASESIADASVATDVPPPDPAPAPAPERARRLLALEASVEGSTEIVVLRFEAPFREADLFAALIGPDPPRYLLRLRGIERPWRPPDLEVASPLMQRIRTGLHSTPRGPELHLVIDLNTRAIEHSWAIDGDTLRVRLVPLAGR